MATVARFTQRGKSGTLIPGDFTGNPKRATVVFANSYTDTNYAITLSVTTDGTKAFSPITESKTASGFVVNLGSNNVANLEEVGWHTLAKVS